MAKAYLSLGSNIGNRSEFLSQAIKELNSNKEIVVTKISSVYETAPVGFLDQDNFLNIAIEIETCLDPWKLLKVNQEIENKLQRVKKIHWGPRTIDIDIITYNDKVIENEVLNIPHKEALNRAFVLVPLEEIVDKNFTIKNKKIKEILKKNPPENNIIWLSQETLPF